MNFAFIALGICASALGVGRLLRLRDDIVTLTQKAILVSLFSIGIGGVAYGTRLLTAPFYDIGNTLWHLAATVLVGALEMVFLTLRVRDVKPPAVHRVVARSTVITSLLLISWPIAQAGGGPAQGVSTPAEHNFPSLVSLLLFPAYVIWGLSQVVILSLYRVPQDIQRRPINTVALALVSAGALGFIAINAATAVYLNTGRIAESGDIIAYSPITLGASVAGACILAMGERVYEGSYARYQVFRLGPLWQRLDELSGREFHLSTQHLSAPARLQRAYVEISDAICTLRVDTGGRYDLDSVAASLRRGDLADDRDSPTLSEALPERRTRREDLEAIHALAKTYRLQRASASS